MTLKNKAKNKLTIIDKKANTERNFKAHPLEMVFKVNRLFEYTVLFLDMVVELVSISNRQTPFIYWCKIDRDCLENKSNNSVLPSEPTATTVKNDDYFTS